MAETLLATGVVSAYLVAFAASLWLLYVLDPDRLYDWPWRLGVSALMAMSGMVAFGLVWLILFVLFR
jgi:hypothetical protein